MSKRNKAIKAAAKPAAVVKRVLQATAWSLPHQTPARAGVYEVKADDGTPHQLYSHWGGGYWGASTTTPEHALELASVPRLNQQVTWRGIVK